MYLRAFIVSVSFAAVSAVASVAWIMVVLGGSGASAQNTLREDFETADPSWRDTGGDTKYRVEAHQRSSQRPHSGTSCEYIEINAGNGTYVHLSHDVGPAPVMAELAPSLWVRADRPGVRLLARVVLPHTTEPRTGKPVTRLLAGTSYSSTGRWQQLRIDDVPGLLYELASAISSSDCNIEVVLIDTEAHKALDVFYITSKGQKLTPEQQTKLEQRLIQVCNV